MRLDDLVKVSAAVAVTSGRLEKTARLADALKMMRPDEIETGVAFLSGSLPQGRIGLGWSAISQARTARGADQPSLELLDVDATFRQIAGVSGGGAARQRRSLLQTLFESSTAEEQDFLIRLLGGELRQGAVEGVLTDAIAKASGAPIDAIRHAAMMSGNLGEIARVAMTEGPAALSRHNIQLFRPVEPMLASTADTVSEALGLLGEAALEFKLDGARIQVHKDQDEVRVFSRALRDVTSAVPEVVEAARDLPARDVILDGEVLALTPGRAPLPFQETMRRFGRRLEIERLRAEMPLTPFFFDCLYLDGRSLTAEGQRLRADILQTIAPAFTVARRIVESESEGDAFFKSAIGAGHEGVMAKALDAPYVAGSRGRNWLKIKQVRTLDLVVLAAEWGNGRRRGWLSNLHLGARDPERGGFVMLGKTFKGLTDDMLKWQTAALLERETGRDPYTVYVRPELVVEIAFNDVQESPQYPGALALRFARVKRYRPDKTAAEADTLQSIQEIYRAATNRDAPARRP